ncbi:arginine vasopressin-induced protein 1 [Stigmatopora argus]
METEHAALPVPPATAVASALWRKHGSADIFSEVQLWQLQRLFRAAGDGDAEQRARLVWGRRDEAQLARALAGLRTESRRRGPRNQGAHWMRAFNRLRIEEGYPVGQEKESSEEADSEDSHRQPPAEATGTSAEAALAQGRAAGRSSDGETPVGSGARRRGERDPERYLHRIRH